MIDLVHRLRAPSGGVVADTQIIEAARLAADEIELLRSLLIEADKVVCWEHNPHLGADYQERVEAAVLERYKPYKSEEY